MDEVRYCFDPKHDEPCPLPCRACEEECDPNDWRTLGVFDDDQPA